MRRLALVALAATLGWWAAILTGLTVGSIFVFAVGPLAGRIVGALVAGSIGAAVEARADTSTRGKRVRFVAASAVATCLAALCLLDVAPSPWLALASGAMFGGALGAAQALALAFDRRSMAIRTGAHALAWSLGFLVLRAPGAASKLGVIAPALAVLFTVAFHRTLARRAAAPAVA